VRNLQGLDVPGYTWLSGLLPFERPNHHLGLGALVKKDFKGILTPAHINKEHEFMWLKLTGNSTVKDTFIYFLYVLTQVILQPKGSTSTQNCWIPAPGLLLEEMSYFLENLMHALSLSQVTTPLMLTGPSSWTFLEIGLL
jgi:hypothetical protein